MGSILLSCAAVLCILTALIHSYVGERKLISPLLRAGDGIMAHPLAKQVLRFAWHWTSLLWLLVAAYLVFAAKGGLFHMPLLLGIGFVHLAAGIMDAVYTRGKHIGWPFITLIGVLVLAACFLV